MKALILFVKERQDQTWLNQVIIILSCIILYRNILDHYAYTDVYEFLVSAPNANFIDIFIQTGRLMYGYLNQLFFNTFDTIETVGYIRLISLIGGIVFALTLFQVLLRFKFSPSISLLIVLIYITTPSFGIITLWAATYQISWAMTLAIIAGTLICLEKQNWYYIATSGILGVCSLALYQSAYPAFILPIFLRWLNDKNLKRLIKPLGIHFIVYLIYYFFYKSTLVLFELPPTGRNTLNLNILNNLVWFFDEPLEQALKFNFIFAPRAVSYIVRVLFLILLIYCVIDMKDISKKVKANILTIGITLSFLLVTMIPTMISTDTWISYRTMNTLFIVLIIQVVWGLSKKLDALPKSSFILGILFCIVCFVSSSYNTQAGFLSIQKKEVAGLKEALKDYDFNNIDIIYYIPPPMNILKDQNVVERVVTDEYGRLSSSSDWVPEPLIRLIIGKKQEVKIMKYQGEPLSENQRLIDIGKVYLEY